MMVLLFISMCAGLLLATAGDRIHQGPGARIPVLIELFTSEGCSSCPPADDLLRRLVRDQPIDGVEVVAISEHVDYWNRLGWTDPFSSPRYSQRQNEFAQAFGTSQIYTPQLVVDGHLQVVGSDGPAVNRAIAEAATAPRAHLTVSGTRSTDNRRAAVRVVVCDLPPHAHPGAVQVVVAIVEDGLVTEVRRGENARRSLRHDAVARSLNSIATIDTRDAVREFSGDIELQADWARDRLRVIAFLQDEKTRRVLGAGVASLKKRPGSAFESHAPPLEFIENLRLLFELDQRAKLGAHVRPVKVTRLPEQDTFDVHPVLLASRKGLEDDEILGRAGAQRNVGRKLKHARPIDDQRFEWQTAKRDVQAYAGLRPQEQHSPGASELCGVLDPRLEDTQQVGNVRVLTIETGHERRVDVDSLAGLAPPQNGQAPDKTKPPSLGVANRLQMSGGADDLVHYWRKF